MSKAAVKKPNLNLEFEQKKMKSGGVQKNKSEPGEISLVFDLDSVDFDSEVSEDEKNAVAISKADSSAPTQEIEPPKDAETGVFEIDSFELDENFYSMQSDSNEDRTMKTIVFNPEDLKKLKEDLAPEKKVVAAPALVVVEEEVTEDDIALEFGAKENLDQDSSEISSEFLLDTSDSGLVIGKETSSGIDIDIEIDEADLEVSNSNLSLGEFEESAELPKQDESSFGDATSEFRLEEFNSRNEEVSEEVEEKSDAVVDVEDIEEFSLSEEDLEESKKTTTSEKKEEFNEMNFTIDNISTSHSSELSEEDFELDALVDNQESSTDFSFNEELLAEAVAAEADEEFKFNADEVDVAPPVLERPLAPKKVVSTQTLEDQFDIHATIRALRQERETFLEESAALKVSLKEYEQDILTLRANLEESRIEVAILRKRHANEMEDHKYRLVLAEDKMHRAQELAKVAQEKSLRLEQKIRIDYSQVKHREKELESKLELLTMDVDAQINTRDQKILELRRKIDSLEFNMENASIREQKSNEDKKRLEDRLGKMMKTLKHSIKHLEDEIDEVVEENQSHKDKN